MIDKIFDYSPKELMQFFNDNIKYSFVYRNKIFTDM